MASLTIKHWGPLFSGFAEDTEDDVIFPTGTPLFGESIGNISWFPGGRKQNPGCLWNSIHVWLRMSSRNAADEWCFLPMKDAACDTRGRSALAHRSNSRSLVGNSILMFTHDKNPEYGEIWVVSIHTSWYTSSFYCFVFVPFFGWLTSEGWLGVVGHFLKLQGARDPCFIALWILKRHRICGDLGLQWWISVDCVTIGYSTR